MNKKRFICWLLAVVLLLTAAVYNLSMLNIKTQEAQAACVRFYLSSCNNSGGCCGGASAVSTVLTGYTGQYCNTGRYVSLCTSL